MRKLLSLTVLMFFVLPLLAQQEAIKQDSIYNQDTTKPYFSKTGNPISGLAGIYHLELEGTKTANGDFFLNNRLTAGTNTGELNSWVLLTNPKNKKSVMVWVNDRLSTKQVKTGTTINLSRQAATSLGILKNNTVKIKIESIIVNDSLLFNKQHLDTARQVDTSAHSTFRPKGRAENGIASFYSYNLDGTLTSTGERYRNNKFTAASNHFKLNTWVLVTNLRNHKSVIVRINDRMHPRMKKKGRVVDLSRVAARTLDFVAQGLTKVKVQPIVFVVAPEQNIPDALAQQNDSIPLPETDLEKEEDKSAGIKTGIASFYSPGFDGRKTASGEIFRNSRLSAASNDFDLNTWVRVTNIANGKSVILRINDRMHPRMQKKGRVIDLSRLAAQKLGFIKKGLTKVKVEIVPKGTQE